MKNLLTTTLILCLFSLSSIAEDGPSNSIVEDSSSYLRAFCSFSIDGIGGELDGEYSHGSMGAFTIRPVLGGSFEHKIFVMKDGYTISGGSDDYKDYKNDPNFNYAIKAIVKLRKNLFDGRKIKASIKYFVNGKLDNKFTQALNLESKDKDLTSSTVSIMNDRISVKNECGVQRLRSNEI